MVTDFLPGGDEEDRTLDLTDANRTLSQLSYKPILSFLIGDRLLLWTVVPSSGFICTPRPPRCERGALASGPVLAQFKL